MKEKQELHRDDESDCKFPDQFEAITEILRLELSRNLTSHDNQQAARRSKQNVS